MHDETDETSKMKETEDTELAELNEFNEEVLSEEEIKERKKWIEDAEKSGRIFLICVESFVVISIVLLVAVGALSYEKNLLTPCIQLKSDSGDMTCKTGNFAFGFSAQSGDEPPMSPTATTTLRPNPGNCNIYLPKC